MAYKIKCLSGIHSKDDFLIKAGEEKEVSKEIYDYFKATYATSDKFEFSADKPKQTAKETKKAEQPKKTRAKVLKNTEE